MVAVLAEMPRQVQATGPKLVLVRPEPRPPARPGPAVYRWRRTVAAGALAALVLALWLGVQAVLGHTGGGPLAATGGPGVLRPAAARIWVVRPGDTIWGIAAAVDPKGDERPLVDRLSAEVHGAPLYPGEALTLP